MKKIIYTSCAKGIFSRNRGYQVLTCTKDVTREENTILEKFYRYDFPKNVKEAPIKYFYGSDQNLDFLFISKPSGIDITTGRGGNFLFQVVYDIDFTLFKPSLLLDNSSVFMNKVSDNILKGETNIGYLVNPKLEPQVINLATYSEKFLQNLEEVLVFLQVCLNPKLISKQIILLSDNAIDYIKLISLLIPNILLKTLTFDTYCQNPFQSKERVIGILYDVYLANKKVIEESDKFIILDFKYKQFNSYLFNSDFYAFIVDRLKSNDFKQLDDFVNFCNSSLLKVKDTINQNIGTLDKLTSLYSLLNLDDFESISNKEYLKSYKEFLNIFKDETYSKDLNGKIVEKMIAKALKSINVEEYNRYISLLTQIGLSAIEINDFNSRFIEKLISQYSAEDVLTILREILHNDECRKKTLEGLASKYVLNELAQTLSPKNFAFILSLNKNLPNSFQLKLLEFMGNYYLTHSNPEILKICVNNMEQEEDFQSFFMMTILHINIQDLPFYLDCILEKITRPFDLKMVLSKQFASTTNYLQLFKCYLPYLEKKEWLWEQLFFVADSIKNETVKNTLYENALKKIEDKPVFNSQSPYLTLGVGQYWLSNESNFPNGKECIALIFQFLDSDFYNTYKNYLGDSIYTLLYKKGFINRNHQTYTKNNDDFNFKIILLNILLDYSINDSFKMISKYFRKENDCKEAFLYVSKAYKIDKLIILNQENYFFLLESKSMLPEEYKKNLTSFMAHYFLVTKTLDVVNKSVKYLKTADDYAIYLDKCLINFPNGVDLKRFINLVLGPVESPINIDSLLQKLFKDNKNIKKILMSFHDVLESKNWLFEKVFKIVLDDPNSLVKKDLASIAISKIESEGMSLFNSNHKYLTYDLGIYYIKQNILNKNKRIVTKFLFDFIESRFYKKYINTDNKDEILFIIYEACKKIKIQKNSKVLCKLIPYKEISTTILKEYFEINHVTRSSTMLLASILREPKFSDEEKVTYFNALFGLSFEDISKIDIVGYFKNLNRLNKNKDVAFGDYMGEPCNQFIEKILKPNRCKLLEEKCYYQYLKNILNYTCNPLGDGILHLFDYYKKHVDAKSFCDNLVTLDTFTSNKLLPIINYISDQYKKEDRDKIRKVLYKEYKISLDKESKLC